MKYIAYLFCYFVYPFSFLFFRKKNKLSFGSFRKSFNDNSKYFFIYCQQHQKGLDSAWLSLSRKTVKDIRAHGLKAYYTLSPRGIWYALTSKYWFVNSYTSDIMFCLSGGAVCVNLWHGLALKNIEFNITSGKLAKRYVDRGFKEVFTHPECFKRPDYVLSSSHFQSDMFASAFRIPVERCLEYGYPRNMILTCPDDERMDFVRKYEPTETRELIERFLGRKYSKVFVYMPTWRDSQLNVFTQSFDMPRLDALLKERNELLLLKPHANTKVDKALFENLQNVCFVDGKMDVYPVLPYTDVLITDYSSILYDYILMSGKDVILYLYDYADYVKDRDLYCPYDENVVGRRVYDFEELYRCLENDEYAINSEERNRIIEKFWGDTANGSNSCIRIAQKVHSL